MGKTVLIIEDSRTQAHVISKMLKDLDYIPEVIASHSEALERLSGPAIDLLLLDVFLGKDNSLDHLQEYRALQPGLVIAVMTGGDYSISNSISDAINRSRRAHVDYILAKPFKLLDLRQICDEIECRQMQNMISIEEGTVFLP